MTSLTLHTSPCDTAHGISMIDVCGTSCMEGASRKRRRAERTPPAVLCTPHAATLGRIVRELNVLAEKVPGVSQLADCSAQLAALLPGAQNDNDHISMETARAVGTMYCALLYSILRYALAHSMRSVGLVVFRVVSPAKKG